MGWTDREGEWAAVEAVRGSLPQSQDQDERETARPTAQDVTVTRFSIRGSNGVEERKN